MLKNLLLATAAVVALSVTATAAVVDNITTNTWYTGHFTTTGTPLLGDGSGGVLSTNGPILPNITKQPVALPAPIVGGLLSAVITLPHGGYLLVTDVEISGDQFEMFVNGAPAAPAAAGATGLIPGGQAAVGSKTSVPVANASSVGEDISAALADPNFSSGTFRLPAGTSIITGNFLGTIANGNMNLIVETPEPTGLAILAMGLAGLGVGLRRRRG